MITAKGRFEYFRRSYQNYVDQTYPNKELVIVNDEISDYQKQIADFVADRNDVLLVFLRQRYTLGNLRNLSIRLCSGDIFAQWDDDDFNMPERLSVQYNWLSKHSYQVCYLTDQLHYYFDLRELYWESWQLFQSGNHIKYSLIPGTIMAYTKDFNFHYPVLGDQAKAGEDTVLSDQIVDAGVVTLLSNFGFLNVYSYHGKNVYDIEHHLRISKNRSYRINEMRTRRNEIAKTLNYLGLNDVKVMGREGIAFLHK